MKLAKLLTLWICAGLIPSAVMITDSADACCGNPTPSVNATVDKATLWPPNHQMISVTIQATVNNAPTSNWKIVTVNSSEFLSNGEKCGDGGKKNDPDFTITDGKKLKLRAERCGSSSGRQYEVVLEVAGQRALAYVSVPHSMKDKKERDKKAKK